MQCVMLCICRLQGVAAGAAVRLTAPDAGAHSDLPARVLSPAGHDVFSESLSMWHKPSPQCILRPRFQGCIQHALVGDTPSLTVERGV